MLEKNFLAFIVLGFVTTIVTGQASQDRRCPNSNVIPDTCSLACSTANNGADCEAGKVCCFNGCGYTCVEVNTTGSTTTTTNIPSTRFPTTKSSAAKTTTKLPTTRYPTTKPTTKLPSTRYPTTKPTAKPTYTTIRKPQTPSTTQPCIMCLMYCEFGMVKGGGKDSCPLCECNEDPCKKKDCPAGQWCRPLRESMDYYIAKCEDGPRPSGTTRMGLSVFSMSMVLMISVFL